MTAPPPPPPETRTNRMLPVITGVAGAIAGGLLGATLTMMGATGAPTAEPTACGTALQHAEEAFEIYRGAFINVSDAMGAYERRNYTEMARHTDQLMTATEEIQPALTNYYIAKKDCLEN